MTVIPLRSNNIGAAHTVSFDVTFTGDAGLRDAATLLTAVKRVAAELGTATVAVTPIPATPAHPGASLHVLPSVAMGTEPIEVRVYPESRQVLAGRRPRDLTRLEFDLLHFLAQHPRRVFTRVQLMQGVWGHVPAGQRSVDVHIRRLRMKVTPSLVTTVRGVGYRLAADVIVTVVPHN